MPSAMATSTTPVSQTLHDVQKARKAVLSKIGELRGLTGESNEVNKFAEAEALMSDLRLACMHTVFLDFKVASEKQVEEHLWQTHVYVNNEYRKMLGKLKAQHHVVVKRKLTKQYTSFLRTAHYFYRGYIQRLWARFEMPELERIAQEIQMEGMSTSERVDPASMESIKSMVVSSCHDTLIHLGDLSRYRQQAGHKGYEWQMALTYYSLAHDIKPDSGYAHHQMGVVFLGEKKHLDIVYHFYRAMTVVSPHPNASLNLEVEMKSLLSQQATSKSRTGPVDVLETFASWFVRLHARFYKGEEFSQKTELEQEVFHRLETTAKSSGSFPMLFKMIIINICAYSAANKRVSGNWTLDASRSCQYILGLNVRFISTFAHILVAELEGLAQRSAVPENEADPFTIEQLGHIRETILPLLRVYMMWTCVYASDLVRYEEHLEPHIHNMYSAVDSAASILCKAFGEQSMQTSSYLLPEDIETLGILPLQGLNLPAECRLHHVRGPCVTDQGGVSETSTPKSRITGTAADNGRAEMLSRVADILTYHAFLRSGGSGQQEQHGIAHDETDRLAFVTQDIGPSMDDTHNSISVSVISETIAPELQQNGSLQLDRHTSIGRSKALVGDPYSVAEENMDNQLAKMLGDFLIPPESHAETTSPEATETSYGMNSSTANEVFGAIGSRSPASNTNTSRAIPSLPWNNVWTPETKRAGQRHSMSGGEEDWNTSPFAAANRTAAQQPPLNAGGLARSGDLPKPQQGPWADHHQPKTTGLFTSPFTASMTLAESDLSRVYQEHLNAAQAEGYLTMGRVGSSSGGFDSTWMQQAPAQGTRYPTSGMTISTFPPMDQSEQISPAQPANAPWAAQSPYQQAPESNRPAHQSSSSASNKQQVLLDLLARQTSAPFG